MVAYRPEAEGAGSTPALGAERLIGLQAELTVSNMKQITSLCLSNQLGTVSGTRCKNNSQ